MAELTQGALVGERVRLVRPLAAGALSSLWVAEHLTLGTEVAVKVLRAPQGAQSDEARARFEREARAAAQLRGPHVVRTFDHGVMADGTLYVVMELLEGESLDARLRRTGPLDLPEAAAVVRQVAAALGEAHRLGIVHRDVKPANIFLVPADEGSFVKLLDFGVAKGPEAAGQRPLTRPGAMLGTVEYMSREQVVGARDVDWRADLWALGVVAYEVLTGRPPFRGDTVSSLFLAIRQARFTPPSELRPGLGPALDAWFARAFEPDPEKRFASAGELGSAFVGLPDAGEEHGVPGEPEETGAGRADEDPLARHRLGDASRPRRRPASRAAGVAMAVAAVVVGAAIGRGAGGPSAEAGPTPAASPAASLAATAPRERPDPLAGAHGERPEAPVPSGAAAPEPGLPPPPRALSARPRPPGPAAHPAFSGKPPVETSAGSEPAGSEPAALAPPGAVVPQSSASVPPRASGGRRGADHLGF
ncbi:MAG: protein kinase [Deltaproteobacteria bacterium]|nr:protein kinase [Deltaproteobacteria bacterium]